jgi:prepilin-type N-terminal cleavage/methylation domain-containing protein
MATNSNISPCGSEAGFTMIELLVAMTMAVVLTGAAVALLVTALKDQPKVTNRADQVGKARIATEQMVRELRQGVSGSVNKGETPSASKVTFETYVDGTCGTTAVTTGTLCKVTYACAGTSCTRTTKNPSTGTQSAATTFIEGVFNPTAVFEYTKAGSTCASVVGEVVSYVSVTLELLNSDKSKTVLADGADPRSCP